MSQRRGKPARVSGGGDATVRVLSGDKVDSLSVATGGVDSRLATVPVYDANGKSERRLVMQTAGITTVRWSKVVDAVRLSMVGDDAEDRLGLATMPRSDFLDAVAHIAGADRPKAAGPSPSESKPPFHKFSCLDVSIAHVTREDVTKLTSDAGLVNTSNKLRVVYWYDEGFFVYVTPDATEPDAVDPFREFVAAGYSAAFLRLLRLAADDNCKFLCLDADGPVYGSLPKPRAD